MQRNRWIGQNDDWKHTTRNCPALGDSLPDPTYNSSDSPTQQWRGLVNGFLHELNVSLKAAADLNVTDIPSSVYFNETDPEKLWNQIMDFLDHVNDLWYKHVGEPNGILKSPQTGQCGDEEVERWVQTTEANEKSQSEFEEAFDGQCDAR